MTSASQTHIGYIRDENQDRVGTRQFGENLLLVVCDGMGGERSGSKASSMAIDVFFEHFEEGYTEDMDAYSVRSLLLSSVSAANSVVYTTARMDYQNFGMGTTCVAAFVTAEYIAVATKFFRSFFFEKIFSGQKPEPQALLAPLARLR